MQDNLTRLEVQSPSPIESKLRACRRYAQALNECSTKLQEENDLSSLVKVSLQVCVCVCVCVCIASSTGDDSL